jgi:hypothetical protein
MESLWRLEVDLSPRSLEMDNALKNQPINPAHKVVTKYPLIYGHLGA